MNPDRTQEEKATSTRRTKGPAALPEDLMQKIQAFQESRAILSAIELDVFTAVGEGATAAQVAETLGTDPRAQEMLLHALASIGLLIKQEGVFLNTPVTARYFVKDSPDDARAAMMHTVNLWPRWSTLTECVRAGTSVTRREQSDLPADWTQSFIAAMHRNGQERAHHVVKAVGNVGAQRLLDVGGGSGAYSIAFARSNPELHADILDLESVVPIAQGHIEEAGLADRIKIRAGDLRTDSFGSGYDLVLVSAICHMLSAEENRDLLKRSHKALAPQGRIVIQDFILNSEKTAPIFAALFALNMLVGTRGGSSYSEQEYADWMSEAGFQDVRRLSLPGRSDLMVGTRP